MKKNLLAIINRKKISLLFLLTFNLYFNSYSQWVQKASLLGIAERNGAVSWIIADKAYVVGGDGGSGDLQEYDPVSDTWTIKAVVPWQAGLSFAVGFVINGKGYVCAGQSAGFGVQDELWEYNPLTDTWAAKASLTGGARTGAFGFSIGNKGYIVGGFTGTDFANEVWEYDVLTDSWTQKNDFGNNFNRKRLYGVGTSLNGFGFAGLGNGMDDFQTNLVKYKDFWKYDPTLDFWTQVSNFPGDARQKATIASSTNRIYVGLGTDINIYDDFFEYNPSTDTWNPITNFPSARESAVAFCLNNSLYAGTGITPANTLKDLWELDATPGFAEINNNTDALLIFPNPCQNYFYVNSYPDKVTEISVANYLGEQIISHKLNADSPVVVSSLPSGLYFVTAKSSSEKIYLSKINIIK